MLSSVKAKPRVSRIEAARGPFPRESEYSSVESKSGRVVGDSEILKLSRGPQFLCWQVRGRSRDGCEQRLLQSIESRTCHLLQPRSCSMAHSIEAGYEIISCAEASADLRTDARAAIQRELDRCRKESIEHGYAGFKADEKCVELLYNGWKVGKIMIPRYRIANGLKTSDILNSRGLNPPATQHSAFLFLHNEKQLPPYRAATKDFVMVYRSLSDTLGTADGLFKIYPGSHQLSSLDGLQPVEMALKPNEVLLLDGGLFIQYPRAGGGFGVIGAWKKN